jgi:predicted nucleic acid-binding protein
LRTQANVLSQAVQEAVIAGGGFVPAHFGLEVARTLRRFERHNTLSPDAVDNALSQLRELPLTQDTRADFGHILTAVALARQHLLRVADAAYLELALRLELPLATRDEKLATAATAAGAQVFKP